MPYFSFSLSNSFNIKNLEELNPNIIQLIPNIIYFSKSTVLWKTLNNKKCISNLNFIKLEKRHSIINIGKKILFCLPPSIGLGDAVEYALSLKAIAKSGRFDLLGVAFVSSYSEVFKDIFKINHIYDEVISKDHLCFFDTIFHITLEIKEFAYQKYDRKDIEDLITKYFFVQTFRRKETQNEKEIKKISIFPISKSPLRTMTVTLLNDIIDYFYKNIKIEIILDNQSEISNYIKNNIYNSKVSIINPRNVSELIRIIKKINYGIFMDSGPLHLAKVMHKKGILISTTVSSKVLLKDFNTIKCVSNNYKSFFCRSPCGLVNVFNYNNRIGCYDSLNIKKRKILELKNLKVLQRGTLKKNYVNLIVNPVNCLKNINHKKIIQKINQHLYN